MKTFKTIAALILCAFSAMPVMAQQTYEETSIFPQIRWLVTSPLTTPFA